MAADLIDNELDWVLDIAKELAPTLSVDSIRERIIKRDTNMSIDRFGLELAAYLKDKGDDYRLIFLSTFRKSSQNCPKLVTTKSGWLVPHSKISRRLWTIAI